MAMTPEQLVGHVLRARGYSSAKAQEAFLHPQYETDLHDPFLLNDMDVAVERIIQAHKKQETIGIFGDYDIDGITATTVLTDAFADFGIAVTQHIPNRFIEGYGMSTEGVDALKAAGASLIITVDCGSTSEAEITYANKQGVDVIVTDHHEVPEQLPPALVVLNPKRADSTYPFSQLAGVGVAFKLVQALQTRLDGLPQGQEKWLLDVVAFGTVCDVVPLIDENRVLVYWGLRVASQSRRVGLHVLSEVAGVQLENIESSIFGFVFGPRLNAAGRLDTAKHGLDLMLADNAGEARLHALRLEEFNHERRAHQKHIFDEALKMTESQADAKVTLVAGEGWSEGVVGIVASKLVERLKKPAFVIAKIDNGLAKGSARSFGDFNVVEAIRATEDGLLEKGGGHKHAGGVTLNQSSIEAFHVHLNQFYSQQKLADQTHFLHPKPDAQLETIDQASLELIEALSQLQPFGMANPEPLFEYERLEVVEARFVGSDGQHLKLRFRQGNATLNGIGFSMPDVKIAVGDYVRVIGSLSKNEFRGSVTPQIMVKLIEKIDQ